MRGLLEGVIAHGEDVSSVAVRCLEEFHHRGWDFPIGEFEIRDPDLEYQDPN